MKYLLVIITFLVSQTALGQFIQNNSRSIFSDVRAFKPGDAITVLILEDTQADNSANTNTTRSSDVNGGINFKAGSSEVSGSGGINTGTGHQSRGGTARNEKIRSRLSVKVMEVVENGNLQIEGTRTTKINGETQTIVLKGIVRPVDIGTDNSIFSYSILDLTLIIEGDGTVSKIQEPGLLTKFIRILF
ncbi:MAG: flagellar basal body L-ring protein FlgH [Candidatus Kapabacteria bacterium]|nr:flagellar basal body L-ring protein FlgH [Ignavibacteriota bacterium]MCW5885778.1 flagellar basal body L-ring protein FlgH [Candidatus Kapabacteria bacterium]